MTNVLASILVATLILSAVIPLHFTYSVDGVVHHLSFSLGTELHE
jgi:hypothetical protein